ncbi:2-alkenal reductase (NADP(+)-dependent)-like [Dorcoceras hygrometricum]|uniref:2-alkenal reductase (NADP(+)-dependent)-like n=1 Tax=Dorcoceras hygrometricum TaxID=472368 RepID=A0A2Z7B452_9LAMI|nr:2-alkenal reductase (NADP(+)-dependent)-like [Dorcoceras hygrometricum]
MTSALLIEEAEFSNHDISVADEEKKFISFAYVDSFAYVALLKYKLKVAEIYVEEAGGSNRDVIITLPRAVGTITRAVGTITEAVGTITRALLELLQELLELLQKLLELLQELLELLQELLALLQKLLELLQQAESAMIHQQN